MSRVHSVLAVLAGLLLSSLTANAQTPAERGAYLVNSIMGCGNCHTPMGPNGPLPGMDQIGRAHV